MNWLLIIGILSVISGFTVIGLDLKAAVLAIGIGAALIYFGVREKKAKSTTVTQPEQNNPANNEFLASTATNTITPATSPAQPIIQNAPAPKKVGQEADAVKVYHVTGLSYYQDNILRLAVENSDYLISKKTLVEDMRTNERIWKYEFYPLKVELVPEPDNPHDKNAIMVVVDSEHIGYVKKGSCSHLLKVIREGRIQSISCDISGGPYKYISEDYDEDLDKDVYTMSKDSRPYSATLRIKET